MLKYIGHEFKKMFLKWEIWVALVICFGIAVAGIIETLGFFPDKFVEMVRPRSQRSMLVGSAIGQMASLFLVPILASAPCACSYFDERTNNIDLILISKIGRGKYYRSKMVAVAITGFIIGVLPFILQYLFCIIAVPPREILYFGDFSAYDDFNNVIMTSTVFPQLYMNYPDLYVFVHIGIFGLWVMGLTMLTYTISLYFRKNIIITLATSAVVNAVIMLVLDSLKLGYLSVFTYTVPGPGIYNFNFFAFVIEWCVFILINIVFLEIKIHAQKDIK